MHLYSLTFTFCILLFLWRLLRRRPAPYPPGPHRLPLLGNALEYPKARIWEKFSEWSNKYGDMVYLDVLGSSVVVIHSVTVAKDLLDKRSAIYSDRPHLVMSSMVGYDLSITLNRYGEDWRLQRKLIAPHFAPGTASRYSFVQEAEARKLVVQLLDDPTRFIDLCKLRIANIITRVTFGFHLTSENDPFYTRPLQSMENFVSTATPGNWIVDTLPFLRHLPKWTPGAGFLRTAAKWRQLVFDFTFDPYNKFKKDLETGVSLLPNVCADIFSTKDTLSAEDEWRIAFATSSAIGGGLDTNMSIILTFFLMMLHYPEAQAKGHEEIVKGIGRDRLPNISDRESLPYIRSIITEVMRFHPAATMGVPHATTKDDIYDGMFIPRGSIVLANIWYMLHDPEIFPDPHSFKPERYNNSPVEMAKVTDVAFGFGRRVCPGSAFAEGTLFAIVSTVLATCEVIPAHDETGKEIIPELLFTPEALSAPQPYQCYFRCRSKEALKLLQEDASVLK